MSKFEWEDLFHDDIVMHDMDFILAYVPDMEWYTYEEAVFLAEERDKEEAAGLLTSILEGDVI